MNSSRQSDDATCRAIVIRRDGKVLVTTTSEGLLLPQVRVLRHERCAESVTAAMKREWNCDVVCLFTISAALASSTGSSAAIYQTMELHHDSGRTGHDCWLSIPQLSSNSFQDEQDYKAILRSYERLANTSEMAEPFSRQGWFPELQTWVREVIRPIGLELGSSFQQFNASPTFSLIRFETTGAPVWFKAVGEPNLREFPITLTLANVCPQPVPPVIATYKNCNGWLSLGVEGIKLDETREFERWRTAATGLAALQIASLDHLQKFLDARCHVLTTSVLSDFVVPFCDCMNELMERQAKTAPAVLSRKELFLLAEQIQSAVSSLASFGIPDALGHLDLNAANIVVGGSQSIFLDWAEACIGTPFLSLEYFLQHFRRAFGVDSRLEAKIIAAYVEPWVNKLSAEAITASLLLTPMLAPFAYAVAISNGLDSVRLRTPSWAAYLRGLTRRVKREADRFIDRESLCLMS